MRILAVRAPSGISVRGTPCRRATPRLLNDQGEHGIAYVETEPAKADLESTIQNFLTGQYRNALRVVNSQFV
jgi:hypothetical protein